MTVVINPGTGPVADATEDNARRGIVAFVADLVDMYGAASWDGILAGPHGGYWDAHVNVGGRTVTVSMPGCDPTVTREGVPWVSRRLYVDGSSWLWPYALNMCEPDRDES